MPKIIQGRNGWAGIRTQVCLTLRVVLFITTLYWSRSESFQMGKEAVSMESERGGGEDDFYFLFLRIVAQMNGNATV